MTDRMCLSLLFAPLGLILLGCEVDPTEDGQATNAEPRIVETDLVWAVNVGGPTYTGIDGTEYASEESVTGGDVGSMETVKGSQDAFLYESYREGDISIARPITNGIYDVTFHFAEPNNYERGDRLFDAIAEGQRVIEDLDVILYRDGKMRSALTITVRNVVVADGELNIRFEASAGQPTLSALAVRDKNRPAENWELVWSDEFDGEVLDAEKWSPNIWPPRKVNDEDQAYTGREENLRVEDGYLVIEAHKEGYEGAEYTSGRVHSDGKGDFLYGRFEIRAKLPAGVGTWPAIWMLPSDPFRYASTCEEGEDWQGSATCDAWPNSGEIDIMEHVGYQMGHIHGTVHNEAYYWVKWEQRKGRILIDDVDTDFHTFALEWTPKRIDAFVDDVHYFAYVNEGKGWQEWPYDQPFHLIMNIAIGGVWGRSGGGIDDAIFPLQMLVDYVRVYTLESGA
ncbi:MAG: family 16 glycosylhydrolase [Woeseiaceae bacterium]